MKLRLAYLALPALLTLTAGLAPRVVAQGPPGMMGMRGASANMNPAVSAIGSLLNRNDVKTEITLSQKQGEQMTELQTKSMQELGTKIRENLPDFKSLGDLSEEERKSKFDEMRTKIQDVAQTQMNASSDASEKKAQEILRAEQWKRLQELDLQFRGPLALAQPKLAEKFALTADQKTKIAALLTEYQTKRQELMTGVFSSFQMPKQGEAPVMPDMDAIKAKMTKATETSEKLRKTQGEKVLPLLTDAQKAAWTAAQGVPFKFRQAE